MQNAPQTRPSLILRLRNHADLAAWEEFTEIYHPLIVRLVRQKGLQHTDALDVAQEVLLRVAGAVERWEPDPQRGTFRGWLHRIARNLVIDFLQKRARNPERENFDNLGNVSAADAIEAPGNASQNSTAEFDLEHRRQVFAWAAETVRGSFRKRTWTAFWRTAVEEQAPADVATELGISLGAVYIARTRVMQKLREEVRRRLNDNFSGETRS